MKLKAFCICAALLLSILLPVQILPSLRPKVSAGEAVLEVESGRLLVCQKRGRKDADGEHHKKL